jgi:adenylate cyclase class 2
LPPRWASSGGRPKENPLAKPDKETEIKLRLSSAEEGRRRLEASGFQAQGPRALEANSVFDQPDGTLRLQRCLLRLREYGGQSILTYKGPPEPGQHKVREELETRVADGVSLGTILHRLGYLVTFRYEKYRTEYHRPGEPGCAVLDETPIGHWLELEGPPDWIDRAAEALGFTPGDYVLDSYGSLYLQYCDQHGLEPGHMIFDKRAHSPAGE